MNKPILVTLILNMATVGLPALAQESIEGSVSEFVAQAPTTTAAVDKPDCKRISLSDDQLEKLHALKLQYKTGTASKKTDLGLLKSQLREALMQVTVDKQAVLSLQNKINNLQADLANSRASYMADASTIFTSEQRQAFRHRLLMRETMGEFGGRKGGKMRGHKRGHGGHDVVRGLKDA